MFEAINIVVAAVSGLIAGASVSLGFYPRYPQPKNIRIQLLLAAIAIAGGVYIHWMVNK